MLVENVIPRLSLSRQGLTVGRKMCGRTKFRPVWDDRSHNYPVFYRRYVPDGTISTATFFISCNWL